MWRRVAVIVLLSCILIACINGRGDLVLPLSPLVQNSPMSTPIRVYVPSIIVPDPTPVVYCEGDPESHELATLMREHPLQQREFMQCDAILTSAAQWKAEDMVARKYTGHCTPDGICANRIVQRFGYRLPSNYTENGNNIESTSANRRTAEDAFYALLNSSSHKAHILAELEFFRAQNCYGIGFHEERPTIRYPWPTIRAWVIMTAPCMETVTTRNKAS